MSFCGVSTEFRRFEFVSPFRRRFAVSSVSDLPLAKPRTAVLKTLYCALFANTVQMACDEGLAVGARASNRGAGVSASVSSTAVSLVPLPLYCLGLGSQ